MGDFIPMVVSQAHKLYSISLLTRARDAEPCVMG